MVASYVIWYIVVGHAAGVLVFLWIWMLMGFYALLKFPKFVVVGKSQYHHTLLAPETNHTTTSSPTIGRQHSSYHRLRAPSPSPRRRSLGIQRPTRLPNIPARTLPSGHSRRWSLRRMDLDDLPLSYLRRFRIAQGSRRLPLHAREFLLPRARNRAVASTRRRRRRPQERNPRLQPGESPLDSFRKNTIPFERHEDELRLFEIPSPSRR
jgi:hypothetical protein